MQAQAENSELRSQKSRLEELLQINMAEPKFL